MMVRCDRNGRTLRHENRDSHHEHRESMRYLPSVESLLQCLHATERVQLSYVLLHLQNEGASVEKSKGSSPLVKDFGQEPRRDTATDLLLKFSGPPHLS